MINSTSFYFTLPWNLRQILPEKHVNDIIKEKEMEESMRPDRNKNLIDLKKDLFLKEALNLSVDYYEKEKAGK